MKASLLTAADCCHTTLPTCIPLPRVSLQRGVRVAEGEKRSSLLEAVAAHSAAKTFTAFRGINATPDKDLEVTTFSRDFPTFTFLNLGKLGNFPYFPQFSETALF